MIAHRLSTIKNAKRICLLTDSGIEEEGTHEELMKLQGKYAHLYQMQFQKIKIMFLFKNIIFLYLNFLLIHL